MCHETAAVPCRLHPTQLVRVGVSVAHPPIQLHSNLHTNVLPRTRACERRRSRRAHFFGIVYCGVGREAAASHDVLQHHILNCIIIALLYRLFNDSGCMITRKPQTTGHERVDQSPERSLYGNHSGSYCGPLFCCVHGEKLLLHMHCCNTTS